MTQRAAGYAEAFVAIAEAEGQLDRLPNELFAVGQAVAQSEPLRTTLADRTIPAARRIGVIEDLLAGKASPLTLNLVALLVGLGRGSSIPEFSEEVLAAAAASRGQAVAEVRSAVALNDDQVTRLSAALRRASGREVAVNVIVDPEVLGGLSVQIDDAIYDGSVRTRLDKMKERLS